MKIKSILQLTVLSILSFGVAKAQNGASGTQGFYLNYNDFVNAPRALGGDCDIDANGYLEVGSNGILNIYGAVRNKGIIEVDSGGQLSISGDMFNEGTIIIKKNAIVYFYGTVWKNTSNAKVSDGIVPNTFSGGLLFFDNKRIVVSNDWLALSPFLVNYSGENSSQYLEGANVPMDVDVHLSNPYNVFLMNSPTRIEGQLTWDVLNSNVILGNNDLIFTKNATQAGYNASKYAITNGGGHVVKENYTGKWVFPVGKDLADYTPAEIDNTTANTMHVSVKDYATSASVEKTELSLDDGIDRTWNIYADIPVGISSITLQHNSITNRPAFSDAYNFVSRWGDYDRNITGDSMSKTPWQKNIGFSSSVGNLNSSGTLMPGSRMNTRLYKDFATLSTDSIAFFTKTTFAFDLAPVVMQFFQADTVNCDVIVKFKSTNEKNIKKFQLQHSIDGLTYSTLDIIDAKGDNSEYSYLHKSPAIGKNFYRLMFIDTVGDYSLSNEISAFVQCEDSKSPIVAYPNPTKDNITLTGLSSPAEIRFLNVIGRVVLGFTVNNSTEKFDISMLPSANYIIWIIDSKRRITGIKFTKI